MSDKIGKESKEADSAHYSLQELEVIDAVRSALHQKVNEAFEQIW